MAGHLLVRVSALIPAALLLAGDVAMACSSCKGPAVADKVSSAYLLSALSMIALPISFGVAIYLLVRKKDAG